MVNTCCVFSYQSRSHDQRGKRLANVVRYFSFPAWKHYQGAHIAIGLPNITFSKIPCHTVVCSWHFHRGKPAYEMAQSHPDWVLTLHLGCQSNAHQSNTAPATTPDPAAQKSKMDEATPPDIAAQRLQVDEGALKSEVDKAASVDSNGEQKECSSCSRRHAAINRMFEENRILKEELSCVLMTLDSLLCQHVEINMPLCKSLHTRSLSLQTVTVSTLYRDCPFPVGNKCTATLRFGIKTLFHTHQALIRSFLPHQFVEAFGNHVALIVDCFEINIERAQTFSHSKHKGNSLISKGWGGFDIRDDVEETRQIAHLRVHVERVIGCVHTQYTILSDTTPLTMVLLCEGKDMIFLDKVVSVCCALMNVFQWC
uniref:DDE Tnp4 domain-containing protein n=1 Tax=Monopterus albus TaxID=43700 RepID=A0A3Q3K710_MONAL